MTHTPKNNSSDFDEQLLCLVQNNMRPNLSLVNDLLPLCSSDGRKQALKCVVKVENEDTAVAVATYCVGRNEFTAIEINNFLTSAVISHNTGLVEVLAPFAAEDRSILHMSILLKNSASTHILIDVLGFDAESFELAAQIGLETVVGRLLPLSDPKNNNSEALYQAVRCNHQHCVDLLYDLSDCEVVVKRLREDFPHHTTSVWDDFKARVERDVLLENVGNAGVLRISKM